MEQSDIDEKKKIFEEKKKEIDEKYGQMLQKIDSTMADIAAIPTELAGQSLAFIDRKTKKQQEKVQKEMDKAQRWVEERLAIAQKWLEDQMAKLQKKIDEEVIQKAEIEKINAQLKIMAAFSAKTGSELPELPEPEAGDVTAVEAPPSIPEKFLDDEYLYLYKDNKGQYVPDLGTEVAKRKRYKSDIYSDEKELLVKAGIRREKFKWSFSWVNEEWDVDPSKNYELVQVKKESGLSAADLDLEKLSDVFIHVNPYLKKYEGATKKWFSENAIRRKYEKFEKYRLTYGSGAAQAYGIWKLTINRTT